MGNEDRIDPDDWYGFSIQQKNQKILKSSIRTLLNGAFVVLNFEEIRNTARQLGQTSKKLIGEVNNTSASYAIAA